MGLGTDIADSMEDQEKLQRKRFWRRLWSVAYCGTLIYLMVSIWRSGHLDIALALFLLFINQSGMEISLAELIESNKLHARLLGRWIGAYKRLSETLRSL